MEMVSYSDLQYSSGELPAMSCSICMNLMNKNVCLFMKVKQLCIHMWCSCSKRSARKTSVFIQ